MVGGWLGGVGARHSGGGGMFSAFSTPAEAFDDDAVFDGDAWFTAGRPLALARSLFTTCSIHHHIRCRLREVELAPSTLMASSRVPIPDVAVIRSSRGLTAAFFALVSPSTASLGHDGRALRW